MRILVTGGAGFIGSHVTDILLDKGHTVRVLDGLLPQVHGPTQRVPAYLSRRAEFIVGKMEDAVVLQEALRGVDGVIHLASSVGVGQSMYRIVEYCKGNVLGTATLLQCIVEKKIKLQSIVVASSMSIYGEGRYCTSNGTPVNAIMRPEAQMAAGDWECRSASGERLYPLPTDEEKPLVPTSVYAINKRDQEELCLSVGAAYDIPTTALRFFNVYGSRQALSNPYTGVAAIFCARLLNDQPPLVFEDGLQKRDFVHVQDVACAIVRAVEKPAPGKSINIGSGTAVSVIEIAEMLAREMGKSIPPSIVGKYRQGDIRHCFANISTAKQLLDWTPAITFRQGVPELIEWVRAQRDVSDRVNHAWGELEQRGLLS